MTITQTHQRQATSRQQESPVQDRQRPSSVAGVVLALQRRAGNQAVSNALQRLGTRGLGVAAPPPVVQRAAAAVRSPQLIKATYAMDNHTFVVTRLPNEGAPTFLSALVQHSLLVKKDPSPFQRSPELIKKLDPGENSLEIQGWTDKDQAVGVHPPDKEDYDAPVVRITFDARDAIGVNVDAAPLRTLKDLQGVVKKVKLLANQPMTVSAALLAAFDKPMKTASAIKGVANDPAFNQPMQSGRNTVAITGKVGQKIETIVLYLDADAPRAAPAVRGNLSGTALLGTEFTFTNDEMINATKAKKDVGAISTEASRAMQQQWVSLVKDDQNLALTEAKSKRYEDEKVYTFTHTDGWYYSVSLDPGVIETQTKPMTLDDAKGGAGVKIQKYIFDVASKLGLHADASFGGGHIHLDVESTFGKNEKLFGDFIADYEAEGTAMEALEHDPSNAPRASYFRAPEKAKTENKAKKKVDEVLVNESDLRQRFASTIEKFRSRQELEGLQAMRELAKEIQNYVYRSTDVKYSALNLQHMLRFGGFKTIELRAIRAQRSYDDFLLEAQLFLKRIEYLETAKSPPMFNPKVEVQDNPSILEAEGKVMDAITNYVKTAGLDPAPYLKMTSEYRIAFQAAIERDTT